MSTYKTSKGAAPVPERGDLLALPKGVGATETQVCMVVQTLTSNEPGRAPLLWAVPGKPHAGGNVGPGQFTAPVMGKLMVFDANQAMQVPCTESIVPKAAQEARFQLGAEVRSKAEPDPMRPALRITVDTAVLKQAVEERKRLQEAAKVNATLPSAAHVEPRRAMPMTALGLVTGKIAPPRPMPASEPDEQPRRPRLR